MMSVRLAVIGAGLMGAKHVKLVSESQDCELVGVCDADPNLKPIADRFDAPFYRDLEALLERESPQGAIIAVPNGSHAAVTEACARRSVHVLIEKPIADSLNDARRIITAADDAGIEVLVGHHRRHNPLVKEARAIVRSGHLGRLAAVNVMWAILKPADYFRVADWRRRRPGGGPTFINLIHEFDILRFVCGEVRRIYAHSSSAIRSFEVEDTLTISLVFGNGALGSVLASDATPSPWSYEAATRENPIYFHTDENCYYFLGEEGSLAFPQMETWRYPDADRSGWRHPLEKSRHEVIAADPLITQLEHFCAVVRGVEKPLVDAREGARSLAVALAVLESSRRHEPVDVPALEIGNSKRRSG
jgi:predicted dehydrogenase